MQNVKEQDFAPVSVVIPCYHCGQTIERAVYSLAIQTWRPAEVIIVDDGSDCRTRGILEKLQHQYGKDWIKLIYLPFNMGPGAARNAGWDISTQPLIAFLDADDSWHPQKLEIQCTVMLKNPDLALTGHRWQLIRGASPPSFPAFLLSTAEKRVRILSAKRLLLTNMLSTSTVMIRRDLPFRFCPNKRYAEDYLLWLEIILSGFKIGFIDTGLAYLYKAPYGEEGLSGKLWKMELGELETYYRLWQSSKITMPLFSALVIWSIAKFSRRVLKRAFRARL